MKYTDLHKILIIRLSSIGDIVLTSAFVRMVRQKFPHSRIDFILYHPYKSIFENNPYIDEIITCEKNEDDVCINLLKNSIEQKQGTYDIIYDLHNNSMSNRISSGLGKIIHKVDKRRAEKLKLVWLKKGKGEPYLHINDLYLAVGQDDGIEDDNLGLEYWLQNDKENSQYNPYSRSYFRKDSYKIVVAPGAHYKTKQWGYLNYAHLIRKLLPIANGITLIGGAQDVALCEKIHELNPNVINLCGKLNLTESCDIIDKHDLLITNDTGVMHIAAARKTPVVTFWGSSVKELGFEPFRSTNLIIETDLKCRPCSHIGRKFCPKIHFKCMNDLKPNRAYQDIVDFMQSLYL